MKICAMTPPVRSEDYRNKPPAGVNALNYRLSPGLRKQLIRQMKLITALLILALVQAGATGYSQKVTLREKNASVETVFQAIEKQTGYVFFYDHADLLHQKISINLRGATLEEALERCFAKLPLTYKIIGNTIAIKRKEQAVLPRSQTQNPAALPPISPSSAPVTDPLSPLHREMTSLPKPAAQRITGNVNDENGEPLPGVSILVKGTQQGTTTDGEGRFQIEVPNDNTVLVFSFVGYVSQEVVVGNRTTLNISLEVDQKALEEVVVVGYGVQKKSDLTGAVSQIKGDLVAERNTIQLSQALQGTVPGVTVTRTGSEPNSSGTIRIRGITTIGTSDPLIIIDGVPGALDRVNPNDVESISVLKDAASASIYGSRAAAGVILVTTKRALKGNLSLNYNYEYGIETLSKLPPQEVSAQDYMRMYNENFWNDNGNDPQFEYTLFQKDIIDNYPQLNRDNPDKYPITDWFDLMLRKTAPRQSHSINITAGGEFIRTKAAVDYSKIQGVYPGRSYERITVRANNDFTTANKKISGLVDINAIHGINDRPRTIVTPNTIPPGVIYAAKWSDGRVAEGLSGANPYAQLAEGGFVKNVENTISGRIGLDFKPIPELKISGIFAPTLSFTNNKDFSKIVPYTSYDNPDYVVGYIQGYATTNLIESRPEFLTHLTQFLIDYTKESGHHKIDAMAGYENWYSNNHSITATRNNYSLTSFPYLNLGNANFQFNSGSATEQAYRSWFGRVIYSYKSRYTLQLNARHDASSRFAKAHRGAFFPSVSAGWVLSEEPFLSKISWLPFLKLRSSWGVLGNERIGDNYPYQSTIGFVNSSIYRGTNPTVLQSAAVNRYAIPDISWETTETFDIGLDASLFNNRLNLALDYYKKTTRDMLLELEVPRYIGLTKPNQNAGKMFTRGWELEAGWNDRVGPLTYSVSLNLSDSRSIMGDLKGTEFIGDRIRIEGSEFNEWYGYKTDGLFHTQEQVDNYPTINPNVRAGDIKLLDISGPDGVPDGRISPDYDRVLLGGSLPRYLYGGNIKLGYKNFDFSAFLQGVGYQNTSLPLRWTYPYTRMPELYNGNYWSHYNTDEQNRNALYPRVSSNYMQNNYPSISDFWLFNGAYFRLKNISLGYTIPEDKIRRTGISRARVYATASDVFSLSKYPKDRDPEGSENFITSSYVLGISISF